MDSLPVTNGEFFEFMHAGGYDERALLAAGGLALDGSLSVSNFLPAGSNKQARGGTGRCSTCYLWNKWQAGRCL